MCISIASLGQTLMDPGTTPTTSRINDAISSALTATGTNSYTVSVVGSYSYTYLTGKAVSVTFENSNTGASTLDFDGLGARNILKWSSGSLVSVESGDLIGTVRVRYDGTQFVIEGGIGSGGGSVESVTGDGVDNTDPANPVIDLSTPRTVTSADNLEQSDHMHIVYADSGTPFNITVELLAVNTQITVINVGPATVTLIEGSGVTLPGTTVDIASGENAIIIYRVPATPDVYTGTTTGGTVTSVGVAVGTSGTDIAVSGSPVTSSGTITMDIPTASASNRGALSSADWSTFNSKQAGDADLTSWAGVTRASGFDTWVATPSWTNFLSAVTGTAPYVPLTGTAALTGNVELTGAFKMGLSNSSAAIGIGLAPGSITANNSFEISSANDTHAIFRNSSTTTNNLQFGVISGTQPQVLYTVGANNTKMYQSAGTFRTETSGSLLYYGTSTTFQNVGATYSYVFSPNANVDNASRPFYLNTPGTSTSAATQAMDTDLYFRGRFWNGSANVTRGFYFHPAASTSNNLEGTLKLYTDIATGSGTEIMRFDQAGNTNVVTNLNVGATAVTNSKAALEVTSTTKGFLPPRMTTTEKNAISSPPEGLIVYDTTLHKLCVYTGSAWETISSI